MNFLEIGILVAWDGVCHLEQHCGRGERGFTPKYRLNLQHGCLLIVITASLLLLWLQYVNGNEKAAMRVDKMTPD